MKKLNTYLLGLILLAGTASAATLERMAQWAERIGSGAISNRLGYWGVRDPEAAGSIMARWDEDEVVDRAIEARAYELLALAGRFDGFSEKSVRKIVAALRAETEPPAIVVNLVHRLPLAARSEFKAVLLDLAPRRYPNQPVLGRLRVKYGVLRGESLFSERAEPVDIVAALLAPEPMVLKIAERARRAVRDLAVALARTKLRAEGKSFVVRDGVNPLTEWVRPVVEALNAPGCAGLEAALRALGAEVPEVDREAIERLGAQWSDEIMAGQRLGRNLDAVLGKLSVALGVEGFNAFVEEYNYGAGGPEQ